jgi:hypothetical protein
MIFFADDIALISTNTAAANRLLAEVGGVSRRTEIEQSGRNDLPWTPQNAPDIENVVQIGHLLEDNSLF